MDRNETGVVATTARRALDGLRPSTGSGGARPSGRNASLVYDAGRQRSVAVIGKETWEWDGETWTRNGSGSSGIPHVRRRGKAYVAHQQSPIHELRDVEGWRVRPLPNLALSGAWMVGRASPRLPDLPSTGCTPTAKIMSHRWQLDRPLPQSLSSACRHGARVGVRGVAVVAQDS